MAQFLLPVLLLQFGTCVTADQTTSIFLPIADPQPLVASVISTSGDVKTMVMQCPDTNAIECGFPSPVSITAGPSTVHLTLDYSTLIVDFACALEESTTATCTEIYTGAASLASATNTVSDGSVTTIWTSSTVLSNADVTFLPMTITAGETKISSSLSQGPRSTSRTSTMNPSNHTGGAVAPTFFNPLIAAAVLALLI